MFEYIFEGPPNMVAGLQPALGLDKVDNTLYIWSSSLSSWIQVGNTTGINDSVQNLTTSQPISFSGATNTFVKATAGAGGISLTLPSAVGLSGRYARVMQVDTGVGGVTVLTTGGQTINNLTSYEITNQYQIATFESDNANWYVISTAG